MTIDFNGQRHDLSRIAKVVKIIASIMVVVLFVSGLGEAWDREHDNQIEMVQQYLTPQALRIFDR